MSLDAKAWRIPGTSLVRKVAFCVALCAFVTTQESALPEAQGSRKGTTYNWISLESPDHHVYVGRRILTRYEVGVRTFGADLPFRVVGVGLPPGDPDGLVRIQIGPIVDDLPPGKYELSVKVVGEFERESTWANWLLLDKTKT